MYSRFGTNRTSDRSIDHSTNQYIQELQAKIQKYEEILQAGLDKPRKIGRVITEEVENFYRIESANGETFFLPIGQMAAEKKIVLEKNDIIWFTENFIVGHLPNGLYEVKELPTIEKITWTDIAGLDSQVETIREAVEYPLDNADVFKHFNMKPLQGLILYGPPGCGKTLIAKAIANTILTKLKKPKANSFQILNIGDTMSRFYGETENRIRAIFKNARMHFEETGIRGTIFVDEADALMPARGSRLSSDVESTIVPTFLAEMDGMETGSPFVILATNNINSLDPAIIRDGRIDLKIKVSRPDLNDSKNIFAVHFKKTPLAKSKDEMSEIATNLLFQSEAKRNVSGAMIETIVKTATKNAVMRYIKDKTTKKSVDESDLINAITEISKPYARKDN